MSEILTAVFHNKTLNTPSEEVIFSQKVTQNKEEQRRFADSYHLRVFYW